MPARGWEVSLSPASAKECMGAAGWGCRGTRAGASEVWPRSGQGEHQQDQPRGTGAQGSGLWGLGGGGWELPARNSPQCTSCFCLYLLKLLSQPPLSFTNEKIRLREHKQLCPKPQVGRARARMQTRHCRPFSLEPGREEGKREWSPEGKISFVGNPTQERSVRELVRAPCLHPGCLVGRAGQAGFLRPWPRALEQPG